MRRPSVCCVLHGNVSLLEGKNPWNSYYNGYYRKDCTGREVNEMNYLFFFTPIYFYILINTISHSTHYYHDTPHCTPQILYGAFSLVVLG